MHTCDGSCAADQIDLEALRPGPAVREGLDANHVRALVEVLDRVPPVLVSCPSQRLLDGHHRFAAARSSGKTSVAVAWWHGEPDKMFDAAVEANATHGLPLTRRARRSAAEAMLHTEPETSDRRIALRCGLAPTTVGHIRRKIIATDPARDPAEARTVVGADGKRYPVPAKGETPSRAIPRRVSWWRRVLRRLWRWLTGGDPDRPSRARQYRAGLAARTRLGVQSGHLKPPLGEYR